MQLHAVVFIFRCIFPWT